MLVGTVAFPQPSGSDTRPHVEGRVGTTLSEAGQSQEDRSCVIPTP